MRALQVRRVVGIELCKPAVEDARANARRNGVANCHFIASKAEDATKRVLQGLTEEERASLVAIVDPPRAGLHADVVKALNSLGATPQDLLAILQAMKSAGALNAEIEVI